MSYRKNIEARISGDPTEQERRKAILNEILVAMDKGGAEAVDEHFKGAFERAQAYLDGVLREKGIDAQS